MEKDTDSLMHLKNGGVADPDATVSLVSGALESSNVNPVEALVTMISLSRQFELQMKAMKTVGDNESSSSQMLRLG